MYFFNPSNQKKKAKYSASFTTEARILKIFGFPSEPEPPKYDAYYNNNGDH